MVDVVESLDNLTVIKRNGKKVDFDATKIALAIKKGFDSVEPTDDEVYKCSYCGNKIFDVIEKK